VEDTIELSDIHHGRTVLKATLDGDLEALQEDLVRVRDLLDDEHDRVAKDLGVEKNKKLHLENHQVYHYSLRITKAVSSYLALLPSPLFSSHPPFTLAAHTLASSLPISTLSTFNWVVQPGKKTKLTSRKQERQETKRVIST
jgi:hypothetical protein